jgi:hypothetical protein
MFGFRAEVGRQVRDGIYGVVLAAFAGLITVSTLIIVLQLFEGQD